jgi:23S rRNA (cytosine1962-C5)-methyltransferase
MTIPRILLKARRAQPFFARHPWVYAGAIDRSEGNPQDGDEVELISHAGNFVARGLFNSQSKIQVRLYSWQPDQLLDRDFWKQRLQSAIRLREELNLRGLQKGTRLLFSEGDLISGLTIDEYDRFLVLQFTSLGLAHQKQLFVDLLRELIDPKGIYLRTERGIGSMEGLTLEDGLLWGEMPPKDLFIEENGVRFLVNLSEGQKTGYYLDQRDNRLSVSRLAKGKRVLDAFCYTGGFGLQAANQGATSVECVDSSESAIRLAEENAHLNQFSNVTFVQSDVFDHLSLRVNEGTKYDLVMLDPPKFARSRNAIPEAMKGYRRLQSLGIRLLNPGGILVTCCCSGLITIEMLNDLLGQLAAEEKREIQILQRLGQAADHPVSATCLESSYLKCFISRVL